MIPPLTAAEIREQAAVRFWPHVDKSGDCWEWTRGKSEGYGRLHIAGRSLYAHRLSWFLAHGDWPQAGLVTDHLCRNRSCVNPDHLEVVTYRENLLRGTALEATARRMAAITHCPRGHEYTPENTYVNPQNARNCRICMRARDLRRRGKAAA